MCRRQTEVRTVENTIYYSDSVRLSQNENLTNFFRSPTATPYCLGNSRGWKGGGHRVATTDIVTRFSAPLSFAGEEPRETGRRPQSR